MALSAEQVQRLVGMKARLWDFMPSHDHLAIKLTGSNDAEEFLVLSGCEDISAPVFWHVKTPRLKSMTGTFLEFLDE